MLFNTFIKYACSSVIVIRVYVTFPAATRLKPIVILTDLRGDYTFYWLDSHILYFKPISSAPLAWGLLDAILSGERPDAEARGVVPQEGIEEVLPPVKRQRLIFNVPDVQDVADLGSLAAFLEPSEARACALSQFLHSLNAIPAVAVARDMHKVARADFHSFYA